jgi:hypothetical protein
MKWKKLGQIFSPNLDNHWMKSHASVPFVGSMEGSIAKIYFSSRNKYQQSSVGYLMFDLEKLSVLEVGQNPCLTKGELGGFDDSGVMGSCMVKTTSALRMYYIGWNLGVTVPFRNSIGVAESYDNGQTFEKLFKGPIIDRNINEQHFVASNCVIIDNNIFKIWYLSCTEWVKDKDGNIRHKYHIKYAESLDGIHWNRRGLVAIDYKDQYEYAISVPRVIKEGDSKFKMWFSARGSKGINTYRICYAESFDGIQWIRKDEEVGIDISDKGWDSQMIEYPFVFDYSGARFLLYNGNDYGKTGFGLAVLE